VQQANARRKGRVVQLIDEAEDVAGPADARRQARHLLRE